MLLTPLAVFLLTAAAARADNADQRFLDGLRQRRLFQLAKVYCRQQLQRSDIDDARRAGLTIELARALASQALEAPAGESQARWREAAAVCVDFAARHPDHPRTLLVELQGALVQLAHGELLREQAALGRAGADRFDAARGELRAAVDRLADLCRRADERLRAAPTAVAQGDPQLTAPELASTIDHLDRQLARAYRLQAACFESGSPDAVNSLGRAVERLNQLLARETSDELRWEALLELARSYRDLKDPALARQTLDDLDAAQPPARLRLLSRAERARLSLAAGDVDEALQALSAGRKIDGQISPELDTAFLEVYLAAAADLQRQERADEGEDFARRADAVLAEIERAHGPYWARRAELMASGPRAESGSTAGVELLLRAAERLHAAGQFDDALAAYDRAAAEAAAAGDAGRAFEQAFSAATIEHQRENYAAASSRYRAVARQQPERPRAPEAHLLAAHDALEAAKLREPMTTEPYRRLLEEHLQLWPTHASANEARWRLARLETFDRRWQAALAAYRGIASDDPRYVESVAGMADVYRRWFAERRAAGDDPTPQTIEAARALESLAIPEPQRTNQPRSEAQREAALAAAGLWIDSGRENYAQAERLLTGADGDMQASPTWRERSLPLLIVALAGQRKTAAAELRLREMTNAEPERLLAVLEPLASLAGSQPEVAGDLAFLQLRAIEMLRPKLPELPRESAERLRRIEAQALAATGRRADARALYDALLQGSPRDGALREEYALFLAGGDDRSTLAEALSAWQDLERRSPPGSDRWFRGKYQIALLHHRLGDDERAAQIIAVTRLLRPEMGGPEMLARFHELEGRLHRPRARGGSGS